MSFVPFSICNAPAASGALCPAISPFLIINAQSVKYLDTAMEKGDGASKKISAIRRHIKTFASSVQRLIGAEIEITKQNELHRFAVLPKRWVVERSFSWLEKNRRLWKNCERKLSTSLQMVALAFLGACYEDCEHVLTTAMSVCKSPLNRKPSGSVLTR